MKKMIKINPTRKIQNLKIYLYDSDNKKIGRIHNELQLLDIQVQIAEKRLEGYYITYKGKRYNIESDGKILNCGLKIENKNLDDFLRILAGF